MLSLNVHFVLALAAAVKALGSVVDTPFLAHALTVFQAVEDAAKAINSFGSERDARVRNWLAHNEVNLDWVHDNVVDVYKDYKGNLLPLTEARVEFYEYVAEQEDRLVDPDEYEAAMRYLREQDDYRDLWIDFEDAVRNFNEICEEDYTVRNFMQLAIDALKMKADLELTGSLFKDLFNN